MQSDINHLNSRLSKIDGFGDTGDYLINIINSKRIESSPPAVPEKDNVAAKGYDETKTEDTQNGDPLEKNGDTK
jgi:vacuolar protein sorting-associated protein 54